ncbi:MAG: hypothetical protein HY951_02455 [Bacteroidia bacterium]|nr:hypothetical protein [Bacteroidia bacterium]
MNNWSFITLTIFFNLYGFFTVFAQIDENELSYLQKQNKINYNISQNIESSIKIVNPILLRYIPYDLEVSFEDTNNVIIETENVYIIKTGNSLYRFIIGDSLHYGGSVSFFNDVQPKKVKIQTIKFHVKDLPISVSLSGYYNGDNIYEKVLEKGVLSAEIVNYDINIKFPIKSFDIVLKKDNDIEIINIKGNLINLQHKNIIENSDRKYPIIIKDIMIELRTGLLKKLDPIVFFIIPR